MAGSSSPLHLPELFLSRASVGLNTDDEDGENFAPILDNISSAGLNTSFADRQTLWLLFGRLPIGPKKC